MYVFYNTSLVYMNKTSGTIYEQREGSKKSKQVHLFRQMCEHASFVTLSAIETGCHCEHDGLSFLSQRLIVHNWVFESVLVYVRRSLSDHPASNRHSILEVSYSLTPLNAARVTNSILYLFCLPPSPVPLSHFTFV